ncbi:hypothetical protein F9000_23145 [Bacteroides fragilis]|nr:hypothetical protein F9000_23145 [Bacteroides fragilis]KAB5426577.1 hypothetical protein F9Z99_23145 [Bacteroides fragilis]TWV03229.1 hypothetical protein FSA69_23085 [Bacteroides fragilis]
MKFKSPPLKSYLLPLIDYNSTIINTINSYYKHHIASHFRIYVANKSYITRFIYYKLFC